MNSILKCFPYNIICRIGAGAFLTALLCLLPVKYLSAQEEPVSVQEGAPAPADTAAQADTVLEELPQDKLVIVLDPGHGGTGDDGQPEGGVYDGFVEKELNLIVAEAMKEELEKYEGVTVYMTRTGDQKLSLEERVNYAKSVDADFLFCLHFNLSKDHNTLFGAECWVSAFGRYYSEGYAFAAIEMEALEKLGLYSRGIKTRLNDRGTDYYGILRHSVEQDLPCVLIEHCHMDHENDRPFCEGREQWEAFGRLDATSVAKYFHLKSDVLGVDYSDYQTLDVPVPEGVMRPDTTDPDICMIEVTDQNMETGEITVELSATDLTAVCCTTITAMTAEKLFSRGLPGETRRRIPLYSPYRCRPILFPRSLSEAITGTISLRRAIWFPSPLWIIKRKRRLPRKLPNRSASPLPRRPQRRRKQQRRKENGRLPEKIRWKYAGSLNLKRRRLLP